MTDYKSLVKDFAERENAAQLFEAKVKAEKALREAEMNYVDPPEVKAAVEKLDEVHSAKAQELSDWYAAELAKIAGPSPLAALEKAVEDAHKAFEDAPGYALDTTWDNRIKRCSVSGVAFWDGDEIVQVRGKPVLADLFIPDDVIAALKPEDEDDEAEVEIVEAAE